MNETTTNIRTQLVTARATITPWLLPFLGFFPFEEEFDGNWLGFEGTVCAVAAEGGNPPSSPVKEQVGNGDDPHNPSLPTKLFPPNFRSNPLGNLPKSSLLDKLSSLSWVRVSEKSGTRPERALFSSLRVSNRVKFDNSEGNCPRRLLSERSILRSRRSSPNSGEISPEKSFLER